MTRPTPTLRITELRKLRRSPVQERIGLFWIEGTNCIEVALQSRWPVIGIFGTQDWVKTLGLSPRFDPAKSGDNAPSRMRELLQYWQDHESTETSSPLSMEIDSALRSIEDAWLKEFGEAIHSTTLRGFHVIQTRELERIADASTPDGVLALCLTPDLRKRVGEDESSKGARGVPPPVSNPRTPFPDSSALAIYQLQDPGNLGTLLRTSVATAASTLVLSPGSVDPTHPKVLRATAGQWFKSPPHRCRSDEEFETWLLDCRRHRVQIVATEVIAESEHTLEGSPTSNQRMVVELWSLDLSKPSVFLLGNEARGLPTRLMDMATHRVHIPMENDVESLNVGVAGAILLYEAMRQRKFANLKSEP